MEKNRHSSPEHDTDLWKRTLVEREKNIYKQEVLGSDVEVDPLPLSITKRVNSDLEKWGFKLRYIPELNFQRSYPLWGSSGLLEQSGQVSKNVGHAFWVWVREGKIAFPQVKSKWMAIETIEQPGLITPYPVTDVTARFHLKKRKERLYDDVYFILRAIRKEKESFLSELGLSPSDADIRLPEILELNLICNSEKWQFLREWTNTKIKFRPLTKSIKKHCSMTDYARNFQVSYPYEYINSSSMCGFRLAIIFKQ